MRYRLDEGCRVEDNEPARVDVLHLNVLPNALELEQSRLRKTRERERERRVGGGEGASKGVRHQDVRCAAHVKCCWHHVLSSNATRRA